ncbi:hypothetical protein FRC19_009452 [Serendipita sp. 401]|nr:hypothetical protein FRC19_009452 [Serendipita sp. 401]
MRKRVPELREYKTFADLEDDNEAVKKARCRIDETWRGWYRVSGEFIALAARKQHGDGLDAEGKRASADGLVVQPDAMNLSLRFLK